MTNNVDRQYTVKYAVNLLCKWNTGVELIVDEAERYTGERLNREARSFAQALRDIGIEKGNTVALVGAATCRFYAAYFGAHKLGAITCNIQMRESEEFIARILKQIDAKVVVCSGFLIQTVRNALAALGAEVPVVALDDADGADALYSNIVERFPAQEPKADVSSNDVAMIQMTSGSTGAPKGIVHTNGSFVRWMRVAPTLFGAVSRNSRFLVNVGTAFAAWPFSSIPLLYAGGTIILMDQFEPEKFCQLVERERVTMAGPVPTMIRMLEPEITDKYDLSSFEMILCAGEPPSDSDIERILSWTDTDIRCLYLASESAPAAATYWELKDLQLRGKPVCAGRPLPGTDLRIIDPDGGIDDELETGEIGEIALRGPTLAQGYLGNEELTAQKFVGGWWRSGDMGHLDEDGYLFVGGRTDNMINTGGIKVHGEEVETCLIQHPAVSQVAVIGVPDEKWGQRVEAHIACTTPVDDGELDRFCRDQNLAGFKRPKRYVFHDELPVGPTGKLDRVTLRKQVLK